MTINALRGRGRGQARLARLASASLPIGDDQASDVFACPSCGRPLASGTTRCAGCGTLLLVGVPARRAGLFVVIGVAGGLVVGGLIAGIVATASLTAPGPAPIAGTSPTTVTTPVAGADTITTPSGGAPAADPIPAIPVAASSALRLTVTVDDRLSASAATLRALLDAPVFDAVGAAAILRGIAVDASYGSDVVRRLDGWAAAAGLQAQLRDYYGALRAAAREGLGASITSDAAYRTAGQQMLDLLAGLPATRAAIDSLAAANGIVLPSPVPGTLATP